MAFRLWAKSWASTNVVIFSDNAAAVATLQAAEAHNPFLRATVREIWLLTAKFDIHLMVRRRPGASTAMRQADALS